MDKDAALEGLELLLRGVGGGRAKDQLALEAPGGGDVPGRRDLLVDQRVVVLQVGAEAFLFERGPNCGESAQFVWRGEGMLERRETGLRGRRGKLKERV